MDARKYLIIIKGKDQTDSVASIQFHDGKCEVVYTSAPNKTYSFQSSNVEILPLQKKIDPAQVIVTANGQTISEIDELLDFGGYYRIVRNGKRDLSFRRNEVQFQQNCLTDSKNQETFQYFKETAAAISLEVEGINILSMQYDKIKQVSEDTVLASYLAPQKDVKMPQMPEAVIYPFGLNQSQKLAVERALSSKISIIQGPPGTGKTQTILNIIANVVRSGKTVAVVSNNNSATHNVAEKLEKKNASFLTAFLGSLANKERFLDTQTGTYPDMSDWEMPPEEQQQLDRETTALSKELNEMLNAKNRIAESEQEIMQMNPEQHYFEEYLIQPLLYLPHIRFVRAASRVDTLGDLVDVPANGGQGGVHPLDIRGVKLDDIPVYCHLPQIRAVPPCGELRHLFIYEPLFLLRHIELHLNVPLSVCHAPPPFLIRVWDVSPVSSVGASKRFTL